MLTTIVIPTKNEEGSIGFLLKDIDIYLSNAKIEHQCLVVDDSDDSTKEKAKQYGAKILIGQHKGLGQAIVDGIEASNSEIILVMDADGSHRPKDLPKMLLPLIENEYDMTIGSRYVKGGSNPNWSLKRRIISHCSCLLALPVTKIKDATSGFFAFRKEILNS